MQIFPEYEEEEPEVIQVVKRKKFELEPMTVDEAIVQMELLAHTFYVSPQYGDGFRSMWYTAEMTGITAFWKLPTRRNGAGMDPVI